MPSRDSDALVLRSYPFREADLVVSFFTRERGKLRGIARGVRRPKNKFGVALERLASARLFYFQKETVELVTLQRAELTGPANLWKANYSTSVVLDLIAEAADRLLPEHEPNDAYFRLLRLTVEEFRGAIEADGSGTELSPRAHQALVYFLIWSARLGGWLPPLERCIESHNPFGIDETVYFGPDRDGLFGEGYKNPSSWQLPPEARAVARAMLRKRVDKLDPSGWRLSAGLALQRYLLQRTHAQLETRLRGADALGALWDSRGRLRS